MERLKPGNRFMSYTLDRCIGKGAFGSVWSASQDGTGELVAIKFEDPHATKSLLPAESKISADVSWCRSFPLYYASGTSQGLCYLVIENLAYSLRTFQENHQSGIISLNETCLLGIGMLQAIRDFHELGFVHRDIKPANFVFRKEGDRQLCLIDFGLAQRWRDPEGIPIPPRPNIGFRGTTRYASMNSHDGFDLGRRDDLWSLFYLLVEFATPPLPWRSQRDKDAVAQVKRASLTKLWKGLPPQFRQFQDHLSGLQFEDDPDYDMLRQLLSSACEGADASSELSAVLSKTYGSLGLTIAPNSGSQLGSSSIAEGSWPVMAPHVDPSDWPVTEASERDQSTSRDGKGGCCLLL
jgi:tau tubulin kinase